MDDGHKHNRRQVVAGFATGALLASVTTSSSGHDNRRVTARRPVFDVADFGAAGDGVTNDTSALSRALSAAGVAGGTVFVAAGTYLHDGIKLPSNARLLGAGSEATILKLRDHANTVSVSNAATAAFNAPLAVPRPALAASSTGGRLSPGRYSYQVAAARYDVPGANGSAGDGDPIGETLASTPVTITTTGTTSTITLSWPAVRDATGYVIYGRTARNAQRMAVVTGTAWTDTGVLSPAGLAQDVDASYSRSSSRDNGIGLCGITIDGNRAGQLPGGQYSAAYFNNVENLHLTDLRVINGTKHGIELHFITSSVLNDVTAQHNGLTGILCYRGVTGSSFTNINASDNGLYLAGSGLVFDHGCSGNVVTSVVAQRNSLDGIDFSEGASFNIASSLNASYNQGSGISLADGQTGRATVGNQVSAQCSHNAKHGLYSFGASNGTFEVTTLFNGDCGVSIGPGTAQVATGNVIRLNAQNNKISGLDVRQDRNTVLGGNCSSNGLYGALLLNASYCSLRNLDVWDNGSTRQSADTAGIALGGTGANNVVESCTVANSAQTAGHRFGIWIMRASQSGNRLRTLRVFNSSVSEIVDNGTGTVQSNNDTAS